MKKLTGLVLVVTIVALNSCQPKASWTKSSVEEKEKLVMNQAKGGRIDITAINELLKAYESFADANPTDTNGANYLFKAADFYRYAHKPQRSIDIYKKLYANYPDYQKRPYALFLQGFIFENEMGKTDSAKVKYEQFIALYPTHPITKDVQATLQNLGKSPEQLIQEFEQKAKTDSLAQSSSK